MRKRILLVDDNAVLGEALKLFLEEMGYAVKYAATAGKALPQAFEVDLAICDLRLGDDSGFRVIQELRARNPVLKVLVLTAYPSIDDLQTAIDLRVPAFLLKPVSLPELLAAVERCLGEEPCCVLLFPAALKERLEGDLAYLGEVVAVESSDWHHVRTQIREVAPSCVLVDVSAPATLDFLDACRAELRGRRVFLVCREADFHIARELIGRIPGAKCVSIEGTAGRLVKAIREELATRRERTEQIRAALAGDLGRCVYAKPLRNGYYCTVPGPCPFGEEKGSLVTVKGKDFHRCPKRPFPVSNTERVGLLSWHGSPDEQAVLEYRLRATDQINQGKTHVVVDCQGLQVTRFNLFELVADIRMQLADSPEARIDLINLSPELLSSFKNGGHYLAGVQLHGPVMVEVDPPTFPGSDDGLRSDRRQGPLAPPVPAR